MAKIITMPRLSDTMTEGVVAKWLKKVGDKINEGDILAEIETDKATMEFESFNSGTLLHIGIQEGETAPVDALLAIIGTAGEDIAPLLNASKQAKPTAEATEVDKTETPVVAESVIPNTAEATQPWKRMSHSTAAPRAGPPSPAAPAPAATKPASSATATLQSLAANLLKKPSLPSTENYAKPSPANQPMTSSPSIIS